MAHIVGHSDTGPRGDPAFPKDRRGAYENLLLLCTPHHTRVDKQQNSFTVADLRTWKSDHEAWVRSQLANEIPRVGFAELEVVMKALVAVPSPPNESFVVTPPAAKMLKNGLSDQVRLTLQMGLAGSSEVERFVEHVAVMDAAFPERVRAGFLSKYNELRGANVSGDTLFLSLCDFAAGGAQALPRQAAGLAVLGYLFMKCEIFER